MNEFENNGGISWECARESRYRAQAKYENLNEKDKRWLDQVRALKPGSYDADARQIIILTELHDNNAINAFSDIFHLGFMKGQRAERAWMKKAQNTAKKVRVLN